MAIVVRIVATAVLIAASWWIWQTVPPLFWGTFVSEFQFLVPFVAIVLFLSLVSLLTGLAGRES